MIKMRKTPEFDSWFSDLQLKEQAQVESRLYRIEAFGHFGDCKALEGCGGALCELRWKNGWRVYFCREGRSVILLLVGGKKNDQKKDIKKANVLLRRYTHCEE